jgi:hypothetical protein
MVEFDFITYMVLVGELVDVTGRSRVGDDKTSLGEGVGCPDIGKGPAATVGDPEAGILAIPALAQVGVGGVVVVLGIGAAAVAAEETHVVDERVFAGLPQNSDGAWIDATGKHTDATEDVSAVGGRENHGLGRTNTLVAGGFVEQVDLRKRRMQADENRVGF